MKIKNLKNQDGTETLVTLAHDVTEFIYDLDPYNGLTEAEALEVTFRDLLESAGAASVEFFKEITEEFADDYNEEELESARNLIERINAFCTSSSENAAGWVSTDLDLPDKAGMYLFTEETKTAEGTKEEVVIKWFNPKTDNNKEWFGGYSREVNRNGQITAWMELPKPYKKPAEYIAQKIEEIEVSYTGGGIYIYMGVTEDGAHFIATVDGCFDVDFMDTDPREAGDDAFLPDWQDEHRLQEYCDTEETFDWFTEMFIKAFDYEACTANISAMLAYKKDLRGRNVSC